MASSVNSHIPFLGAYRGEGSAHAFRTTFQEEFQSFATLPKRGAIPRPIPAQVEHKDLGHIREYVSEAVEAYPHPPKTLPNRTPAWTKLGTNFKMHTDPCHVSFHTTQAESFQPRPLTFSDINRPMLAITMFQKEEHLPDTTHRATFPPYNVCAVVRAEVKHLGGEPTIKGDKFFSNFVSHHKNAFQGKWCSPLPSVEKQQSSSVAMGDPQKIFETETTHDVSFCHPCTHRPETFPVNMKERLKVNLGDYTEKWMPTTLQAFPEKKTAAACLLHKNKTLSCIPKGVTDPGHNHGMMNATSNGFFFSERNHGEKPVRVNGANLRTKSHVELGRPSLEGQFYSTMTQEHYPRRALDPARQQAHTPGRVLNSLELEPSLTTVQRDFLPPHCRKQELSSRHLLQIKQSHIIAPLDHHHFSTTHKDHFKTNQQTRTFLDKRQEQYVSHITF